MSKRWLIAIFVLAVAVAYGDSQQANTQKQTTTQATPKTAQSETQQNTAGSIAGNSGAIGSSTGDSKPQDPKTPQKSAAQNGAPAGNATQTIENAPSAPQNTKSEATGEKTQANSGLGLSPDVDSKTLQSEIDSALKSDPTLANSQLSVNVGDAAITVSGTVPTGKEKVTASRIVQSYAGNRRLQDKITLAGQKPRPSEQQPEAVGAPVKK